MPQCSITIAVRQPCAHPPDDAAGPHQPSATRHRDITATNLPDSAAITALAERHAHFSAEDHVRYYGLNFADRLAEAGFAVPTFRLTPEEEVGYGLLRDAWLNIGTMPRALEESHPLALGPAAAARGRHG